MMLTALKRRDFIKAQYEDYRKAKTDMLEWAATKNNIERILRTADKEKHKERER